MTHFHHGIGPGSFEKEAAGDHPFACECTEIDVNTAENDLVRVADGLGRLHRLTLAWIGSFWVVGVVYSSKNGGKITRSAGGRLSSGRSWRRHLVYDEA